MKRYAFYLLILLLAGCASQQKLSYLSNLPELGGEETFTMKIPDYRVRPGDLLYITARAMAADGMITDFLSPARNAVATGYMQGESGHYLFGYDVKPGGEILLPAIGLVHVAGLTLEEARVRIQEQTDKVFNNALVECKLLSFKYTVIGEVRTPGTYINYRHHINILEAVGQAGGITDFGRRDRVLVVRPIAAGSRIFTINLQDKSILGSEAYFLLPNDVVIVEPQDRKPFTLNLPTYSFIISSVTATITTTLLLINYFRR